MKLNLTLKICIYFLFAFLNLEAQITNPFPYCDYQFTSASTATVSGGIVNVSLGVLNNSTGPGSTASLYNYYNNMTTVPMLTTGQPYSMNIFVNHSAQNPPMYAAIYIDFNRDSVFQSGELIWSQSGTSLPTGGSGANIGYPINFTVPTWGIPGITRMRVIRTQDSSGSSTFMPNYTPAPCNMPTGTFNWLGEVEDYDVEIIQGASVPSVITNGASGVTITNGTLNGNINMNNSGIGVVEFEYGTSLSYGNTIAATPGTVMGATPTPVSATLTTLSPNTLYHYRCKVIDGNNQIFYGNDVTFLTNSLPTPIINTLSAIGITPWDATIRGNANMNNIAGTGVLEFEFGTTPAYGTNLVPLPNSITGTATSTFTYVLSGLTPATTYYYRAKITENGNVTYGGDSSFTTLPLPNPVIITNIATSITENTATLNGSANMLNIGMGTLGFEYGTTTAYGNSVTTNPATLVGNVLTPFNSPIVGLMPNTTYHFRSFVTANGQTHYGSDFTFKTRDATLPNISSANASNITQNSAQLNGFVNPQNYGNCILGFEYGTSPALGNYITANPNLISGNTLQSVNANINGSLNPFTKYYYRLVGNINGVIYPGTILSFSTEAPLGIDQLDNELRIYPNPTENNLTVILENQISNIEIYDLLGRRVQVKTNILSKSHTLDLSQLAESSYFIRVETVSGDLYSSKFNKK